MAQQNRSSAQTLILLGIDPGLAHTGWGIVAKRGSKMRCMAYGCIVTQSNLPDATRLLQIHDGIAAVIDRYHPTELGIEAIYFGVNTKTAFATGQAKGAALVACASGGLSVSEYTPMQIKQSVVGTGSADKEQVQYMVRAILGLDHEPSPDHAADALAAAVCHGNLRMSRSLEAAVAKQAAQEMGTK